MPKIRIDEDAWMIYVDDEVWGHIDFKRPFWIAYQGDTLEVARSINIRGLGRELRKVIV